MEEDGVSGSGLAEYVAGKVGGGRSGGATGRQTGCSSAEGGPLVEVGADVLVAGSATFKGGADRYATNIAALKGDG